MIESPTKPPITTPARREGGNAIKLRLSDGRSWSHEFEAAGPATLRDGCFEAWVACLVERDRRAAERYPAHQTINRERFVRGWPTRLQLHVYNDTLRQWVNANYGTDSAKIIVVAQPGTSTSREWDNEPWETYWLRCLRCWDACYRFAQFVRGIPKFLDDSGVGA